MTEPTIATPPVAPATASGRLLRASRVDCWVRSSWARSLRRNTRRLAGAWRAAGCRVVLVRNALNRGRELDADGEVAGLNVLLRM